MKSNYQGTTTSTNKKEKHESEADLSNSPFVEERNCDSSSLFLGVFDKRYLKTVYGMLHGITSLLAVIFGNLVFINRVLLGGTRSNNLDVLFHANNFIGCAITALFFWNKVQSWQLSTTTMKEKGITPQTMQQLNQGRGVISMMIFSAFPLACHYSESHNFLESRFFSTTLALTLMTGSAFVFYVFRDYGKVLWMVYGMTPMAVGICIFLFGTIASLNEVCPLVLDRIQTEASYVVSCTQVGFLLYYLYSRKLVTKATVQKICKTYHVTLSVAYLLRLEHDLLIYCTNSSNSNNLLPGPMLIQPMILTMAMSAKLLPLLFKMGFHVVDRLKCVTLAGIQMSRRTHGVKKKRWSLWEKQIKSDELSPSSTREHRGRETTLFTRRPRRQSLRTSARFEAAIHR